MCRYQKPVKQGFFGIFEVFTDTIVICTLTALVILCSGVTVNYGQAAGAELTISGFTSTYGSWVSIFTAISMCCFAFSTIIGWGLYGARCIEFIFDEKIIKPFMVAYSLVAILGATVDLGLLWSIADTFNGLMAIPNLIGVFLLSKTVFKLTREYFETEGKDPFYPNGISGNRLCSILLPSESRTHTQFFLPDRKRRQWCPRCDCRN